MTLIRNGRLAAGLTLEEVADRVGMTSGALSLAETAKRTLSDATLRKLLRALIGALSPGTEEEVEVATTLQLEAELRKQVFIWGLQAATEKVEEWLSRA